MNMFKQKLNAIRFIVIHRQTVVNLGLDFTAVSNDDTGTRSTRAGTIAFHSLDDGEGIRGDLTEDNVLTIEPFSL
jgi:hypothetical protein